MYAQFSKSNNYNSNINDNVNSKTFNEYNIEGKVGMGSSNKMCTELCRMIALQIGKMQKIISLTLQWERKMEDDDKTDDTHSVVKHYQPLVEGIEKRQGGSITKNSSHKFEMVNGNVKKQNVQLLDRNCKEEEW
jgi:hypothetical protein